MTLQRKIEEMQDDVADVCSKNELLAQRNDQLQHRLEQSENTISKILGLIQNTGLNKQQDIIDLCNEALEGKR